MSVTVETIDLNLVKVDIVIDAETVKKEYSKACKEFSNNLNIPGFRKGKAPMGVVEKHVGETTLQRRVIENLFPEHFYQAVRDNNLNIVTEPRIESFEFVKDADLKITAKVELRPEIDIKQYKDLNLQYEAFKTPDDAEQQELDGFRRRFSELKTVEENRKTTATDIVVMDFAGYVDGNEINGGSAKNYTLDLGHSNFIPGFAEQLVDREKETDFTIDVTFPEAYHEESLKGKPAQFNIKIHEIKERILPELDDELAKKTGKYKSLEELKNDVKNFLEKSAENENEKRKSNVIFDYIIDNTPIEIQKSMIDREIENITAEMKERIKMQGGDWDKMMENEDSEKILKEMEKEAVTRIKNTLIISDIAKKENIEIKQSDVNMKLDRMSLAYGTDKQTILSQLQNNPAALNDISQQLIGEKVSKFLVENNNFAEKN